MDALVDRLAPSDIAYFVPQWPLKPILAGNVSVAGPLDDLNGAVQLASAGAKIAANFRVNASQETPLYSATATVSGFDLRQWLNNPSLAGVLGGTLEARGTGLRCGISRGRRDCKFTLRKHKAGSSVKSPSMRDCKRASRASMAS